MGIACSHSCWPTFLQEVSLSKQEIPSSLRIIPSTCIWLLFSSTYPRLSSTDICVDFSPPAFYRVFIKVTGKATAQCSGLVWSPGCILIIWTYFRRMNRVTDMVTFLHIYPSTWVIYHKSKKGLCKTALSHHKKFLPTEDGWFPTIWKIA